MITAAHRDGKARPTVSHRVPPPSTGCLPAWVTPAPFTPGRGVDTVCEAMDDPAEPSDAATARVVAELRSTRRRRRLGDTEWGELAYRVYTTAFFVLVVVIMVSGAVGDSPASAAAVTQVVDRGPAWAGLGLAVMLLVAARSGSRGGPLALEAADVQHLLLSPADRGTTLRRPTAGVLGYGIFTGTAVMALTGSLLSQRLPGGTAEFVWSGALFGAVITAAALGAALLTASRVVPRWVPLVLGWALVAWSVAELADRAPVAPTSFAGELLFWPMRTGTPGLVWLLVAIVLVLAGTSLIGGLSIEAARRRTQLVGQLRFAVTQQDLRSVVLLRRQLASEVPRRRRWFPVPHGLGRHAPVLVRDLQSISHWPLVRIARVFALVIGAALATRAMFSGTTPLIVVAGIAAFVAATDATEGLSQEVDHPTLLESLPHDPGAIMLSHLVAPVLVLVVAGLAGLAVTYLFAPGVEVLQVGMITVVTASLTAVAGSVVSTVSQVDTGVGNDVLMTPEVAGPRLVIRTAWPPLLATVGFLPALIAANVGTGQDPSAVAATTAIPVFVLVAIVGGWVRFRSQIHAAMAESMPG